MFKIFIIITSSRLFAKQLWAHFLIIFSKKKQIKRRSVLCWNFLHTYSAKTNRSLCFADKSICYKLLLICVIRPPRALEFDVTKKKTKASWAIKTPWLSIALKLYIKSRFVQITLPTFSTSGSAFVEAR